MYSLHLDFMNSKQASSHLLVSDGRAVWKVSLVLLQGCSQAICR